MALCTVGVPSFQPLSHGQTSSSWLWGGAGGRRRGGRRGGRRAPPRRCPWRRLWDSTQRRFRFPHVARFLHPDALSVAAAAAAAAAIAVAHVGEFVWEPCRSWVGACGRVNEFRHVVLAQLNKLSPRENETLFDLKVVPEAAGVVEEVDKFLLFQIPVVVFVQKGEGGDESV